MYGRDRQSDEGSFAATSGPVIKLLEQQKNMNVQFFPENVYFFKDNAKTHSKIKTISAILILIIIMPIIIITSPDMSIFYSTTFQFHQLTESFLV